jgi:hypothetical protein
VECRDDDLVLGNHGCIAIDVHFMLLHYLRTAEEPASAR